MRRRCWVWIITGKPVPVPQPPKIQRSLPKPALERGLQHLEELQGWLDAAVEIGVCEAVAPTYQQRLGEQCHLPRAVSHWSCHLTTQLSACCISVALTIQLPIADATSMLCCYWVGLYTTVPDTLCLHTAWKATFIVLTHIWQFVWVFDHNTGYIFMCLYMYTVKMWQKGHKWWTGYSRQVTYQYIYRYRYWIFVHP